MRTHVDKADAGQVGRVVAALETLRQRLHAARPDVLLMTGTDHYNNFFLNNEPAICFGIADSYSGPAQAESHIGVGPRTMSGAGDFGRALVSHLLEDGFPISHSQELQLDHSLMIPLSYLLPDGDLPFVPIIVNDVAPPLPSVRTCWNVGKSIGRFVESWSGAERVAFVGTGGLSHWIAMPEMGNINSDWDHRLLDALANGRADALVEWGDAEILEPAGNGAQELRNWMVALGAAGEGRRAEVLAYEPIAEWLTGIAVVDVPLR
jgi:aromatic ring-opening dioxygenase catalytic subunit (LigB family)